MPLPAERKGSGGVSSLIQMFKEKERQEQNDAQKLKPRLSIPIPSLKHVGAPLSPVSASSSGFPSPRAEHVSTELLSGDLAIETPVDTKAGTNICSCSVSVLDLRVTGAVVPHVPVPLKAGEAIHADKADHKEPSTSPIASSDRIHDTPPIPTASAKGLAATRTTTKTASAKTGASQTAATERSAAAAPRASKLVPSASAPSSITSAKASTASVLATVKRGETKTPSRQGGFMAPTASSAARAAGNNPARKPFDTPRKTSAAPSMQAKARAKSPAASRSPSAITSSLAPMPGVNRAQRAVSPSPSRAHATKASAATGSSMKLGSDTQQQQPRTRKPSHRTTKVAADTPSSTSTEAELGIARNVTKDGVAGGESRLDQHCSVDECSQAGEAEPSESGQSELTLGEEESMNASTRCGTTSSRATSASGESESGKTDLGADMTVVAAVRPHDKGSSTLANGEVT